MCRIAWNARNVFLKVIVSIRIIARILFLLIVSRNFRMLLPRQTDINQGNRDSLEKKIVTGKCAYLLTRAAKEDGDVYWTNSNETCEFAVRMEN